MSKNRPKQIQRDCLHMLIILGILFFYAYYESEQKIAVSDINQLKMTEVDSMTLWDGPFRYFSSGSQ